MATLDVLDHGTPVSISFDDLLKYHGRSYVGGVAHGFKVMERAFAELSRAAPPERYGITIATAFPGPGARDAFEMVTRAVTGGRYIVDVDLGPSDSLRSSNGKYFFRLGYEGAGVELTLRPGLVRDEFLELTRKGAATPEEEERLAWLKQDMADRLLALPADEVYEVLASTTTVTSTDV